MLNIMHYSWSILDRQAFQGRILVGCQRDKMRGVLGPKYGAADFVKFTFSKKAMKIDKIFTVDLMFTTQRQIDGEGFINFCLS